MWSRRVRGWRGQGWALRLSADVQTWINCLPLWNLLQRKLEVTWGGEGEKKEEGKHTEILKRLMVLFIPALVISHTVAISLYPSSISSPSFFLSPPQLLLSSRSLYNPLFVSLWPPPCYMSLLSSSVLICRAFFYCFAGGFLPLLSSCFFCEPVKWILDLFCDPAFDASCQTPGLQANFFHRSPRTVSKNQFQASLNKCNCPESNCCFRTLLLYFCIIIYRW